MENITIKSNDMSNSTSENEKAEKKIEKTLDKFSCPLTQSRSQPNVGITFLCHIYCIVPGQHAKHGLKVI